MLQYSKNDTKGREKMTDHTHDGHRQRLMDKVIQGACCEHEYLEMLLCYAIPRRNTNDLAHRLLAEFGSIPRLLSATPDEIKRVKGIGKSTVALLACLSKFCEEYRLTVAHEEQFPQTYERADFLKYVQKAYDKVRLEVLDVYCLDGHGSIFRRCRYTSQEDGRVLLDIEELTKLIVDVSPSGIVLVHNHPFGRENPSTADDTATEQLAHLCRFHNVLLCNHLIYANGKIYDYYDSGKLENIDSKNALF